MENLNANAPVQNSSDAEALESLFNKYEKRNEKKKRLTKEEILAKYFNPRQDTEIFRALPKRAGEELIEEGWFHKVQAGKYAKNSTAVYCPAKNNPKVQAIDKKTGELVFDQQGKPVMVEEHCPICAKATAIRRKMIKNVPKKENLKTEEDKANYAKNTAILSYANKFEAKLYYIVRGIDRGAEKDGVKFWRFKHNFKSQGIHDKLWKPIIQSYYKETGKLYNDFENGVDLIISVVDNEFNGNKYRDVSAINPRRNSSPLHTDPLIAKQWLEDKTTWREVFKPKKAPGITETQYLELAAEERELGQKFDMRNTPYYDEDAKKWVFPNHPDLEAAANTRTQNLDADTEDEVMIDEDGGYVGAAISTVMNQGTDITELSTSAPIPEFKHDSVSMGASTNQSSTPSKYDDLPF